jgi:signal transduction histidine kinase
VEAELAQHAAEAANRAKTDFVAALGHELRTPLQAITGFTELLATLDLDADRRAAALEHIGAAAGHILEMVTEVLDVARIEAHALPLTLVDLPLEPVVADVLAMLEPLATAERVTLRTGPPAAPVAVHADERRVRQVLLNLVSNAIRYNRADGEVLVSWAALPGATPPGATPPGATPTGATDAGRAVLTVRDTGLGIAAAHRDRLFTPFDRLGQDSEEGVGLGLPLARGLTEVMGGTLDVDSEPGAGTTVTVTLPRSGDAARAAEVSGRGARHPAAMVPSCPS